jgi:TetR/AcrR family transcriptional regulator, transcriptional repressor for nem operon
MHDLDNSGNYWWQPLGGKPELDTRAKILMAAFREIHLNGFQAASLNNILAHTGVTKGALYHHFPNKTELGFAVIDEVIAELIHRNFIAPMVGAENPLQALIDLVQMAGNSLSMEDISLGCPLSNLAQEMAPIDEGFRLRLNRIYQQWHEAIYDALELARQKGLLIEDVDAEQAAVMIAAIIEGCLNAAKISQDMDKMFCCGAGLIQYLNLIQKNEGK